MSKCDILIEEHQIPLILSYFTYPLNHRFMELQLNKYFNLAFLLYKNLALF